jgi:hypothetical protein
MTFKRRVFPAFVALGAAIVVPVHAQVSLTPMLGGYVPASNLNQVSTSAQTVAKTRDGTLSLGLNLDLGPLRGSVAYASGTTIKDANRQDIGKGNVLATAADLVIRPIPRILVQPYLLVGAGEKFYRYDQSASLITGGDAHNFAWHGGVGADVMLGPIGVAAELTDFLSKGADDKWNVHDAFLMVGLKLALAR